MAKNINNLNSSLDNRFASKSHGNHVPTTQTADNAKFLRNDNTWQTVTPANIGASASSHNHDVLSIKGTNTISSTANDTTTNWGAQSSSVHWYTQTDQLIDQPNQWGYLLNIGSNSEVHQLWMTQPSGDLRHRGGNNDGWSGTWRTLLDTSNYTAHVTPATIGAASSSQLTTTNTNIGTLSNLQTSEKSNLVAAINEVFQSGVNAKQKLVDALNANGLDCSTSDSWDTLLENIVGKEEEVTLSTYIIQNNALNPSYSFYNTGTRWWHSTTNGLYSQNISGTTYAYITTNQKINFNNYHTIKVTAKNTGAGSKGFKLWVADSPLNTTSTYDNTPNYSTDYGFVDTVYDTQSFDISSWNCEGYLAITRYVWSGHSFYISDIELIGETTVNTSILGGSGFNVISSSTLPETGKENQICVVTNNPVNNFILTTSNSDITTNASTIYGKLGYGTSSISGTVTIGKDIQTIYRVDGFFQGGKRQNSYIYQNGQWNQFTKTGINILRDKAYCTDTQLYGEFPIYTRNGSVTFEMQEGYGLDIYNYSSGYLYYSFLPTAIDISAFNRIVLKWDIHSYGNSGTQYLYILGSSTDPGSGRIAQSYTSYTEFAWTNNVYNSSNVGTLTADISNKTGIYYIGIGHYYDYTGGLCVFDFYLE